MGNCGTLAPHPASGGASATFPWLVDRAKCYLIEKKGYTETDAHRLIEKHAMDTRMSRGEVAQEILEEEEE